MSWDSLLADARLGLRALFIRPIQGLLQPPGRARFASNFFPEGLIPTTLDDRLVLDAAARCTGCGLCDAAAGGGPAPSLLPNALSKASADLPLLGSLLASYDPSRLAAGERLCPSRVPLVQLFGFLERRRARVLQAASEQEHSEGRRMRES